MSNRTRYQIGVKPSRATSLMGIVVLSFFFLFGLAFLYMASQPLSPYPPGSVMSPLPGSTSSQTDPGQILGVIFSLFWLGMVVAGILYHVKNLSSDDAPAINTVEYQIETPPANVPFAATQDAAAQLRELQKLKDENLISPTEYDQKRQAVLDRFG